jgi:hypothetical protein
VGPGSSEAESPVGDDGCSKLSLVAVSFSMDDGGVRYVIQFPCGKVDSLCIPFFGLYLLSASLESSVALD